MRLPLLAAAVATSAFFSTPAAAMVGHYEDMAFVSDLGISDADGDYSLCILQKNEVALWMTYKTYPQRFVLAPNRCESDSYKDLDDTATAILSEAGVLPPMPEPKTHVIQSAVVGVAFVFGLFVMLGRLFSRIGAFRNR